MGDGRTDRQKDRETEKNKDAETERQADRQRGRKQFWEAKKIGNASMISNSVIEKLGNCESWQNKKKERKTFTMKWFPNSGFPHIKLEQISLIMGEENMCGEREREREKERRGWKNKRKKRRKKNRSYHWSASGCSERERERES